MTPSSHFENFELLGIGEMLVHSLWACEAEQKSSEESKVTEQADSAWKLLEDFGRRTHSQGCLSMGERHN